MRAERRLAVLAALVGALLALGACSKKKADEAAAAAPTGGAAPEDEGPSQPEFVDKELTFEKVKIKVPVPGNWPEEKTEGIVFSYSYAQSKWSLQNTMKLSETCGGNCGPEYWAANAKSEAEAFVAFVNDPDSYMPASVAEVVESGEITPGSYVQVVNIKPKDPSAEGGKPTTALSVWRYGPDWPYLVKCEFEADASMAARIPAFREACLAIELVGTIEAAN